MLLKRQARWQGGEPGSTQERTRTAITAALRNKLKELMASFDQLRQRLSQEYRWASLLACTTSHSRPFGALYVIFLACGLIVASRTLPKTAPALDCKGCACMPNVESRRLYSAALVLSMMDIPVAAGMLAPVGCLLIQGGGRAESVHRHRQAGVGG